MTRGTARKQEQERSLESQRGASLSRGLAILLALGSADAEGSQGMGVVQLSTLLGRDKSQVSRSLKVLAASGLVERDPATLSYHLGWRLFALASRAGDSRVLHAAPPALRRLVDEFAEAAHLSTLVQANVLTVLTEDPSRSILARQHVGSLVPAYRTSSGRALLVDHRREELERIFDNVAFRGGGPRAPRDLDELVHRLAEDRRRGFAVADEEFEAGHLGVAAAVRRFDGRVVAAVNISAPRSRFLDQVAAAGRAVTSAALVLSRALGYQSNEE
jgi:IclR family KDG regulon transcriptional repressor